MKQIIFILLVIMMGCSAEQIQNDEDIVTSTKKITTTTMAKEQSIQEICIGLCKSDVKAYCEEQRTIEIDGVEVTGTCRAFARKSNVDGYFRCQGFCKGVDLSTTKCTVDGNVDSNCDGKID